MKMNHKCAHAVAAILGTHAVAAAYAAVADPSVPAEAGPSAAGIQEVVVTAQRRTENVQADYVGFSIPDLFVVGYGLDFAERYRNLPFVGVLRPEQYAGETKVL